MGGGLPNFPDIRRIISAFRDARDEFKKRDPNYRRTWRDTMYRDRWKNLFFTILAIVVLIGFLFIGIAFKSGFYTPIHWWIWMVAASVFLLIALITLLSYVVIIIRGR